MTADRDQHGLTRQQIAGQLDLLGDDEPHEHPTEPAPEDPAMPRETTITGRITATTPNTITITDNGRDTTADIRPARGTYYHAPALGDIVTVTGEPRTHGPDIDAYHIHDIER